MSDEGKAAPLRLSRFSWDDVEALYELAEIADLYCRDEGPEGEGWKSPELVRAIATARDVAQRLAVILPERLDPPSKLVG